jgi:hypothetical protein
MKNHKLFYVILTATILLILFSTVKLSKVPISMFILKGSDGSVDAYAANFFFGEKDAEFKRITLSPENQKLGWETLRSKDMKSLIAFSNYFGKWPFFCGISGGEENWPSFFGRGIRGFLQKDQSESFDNFQIFDRLFFSFMLKTPPSLSVMDSDKTVTVLDQKPVITPGMEPGLIPTPVTSIPQGVVRVEILNGCGITNAADWAARRLKGNGITIVGKDNADNFQYANTIVRSAAGSPVALEEALDRLGLPKESVEEITNPPASADVVVIVGKDFRKLKERLRDRTHH